MNRRTINLILILILIATAIWVDLPNNPGIHIGSINRNLETALGLDLRGGLEVLLEVDLPSTTAVTTQQLADAQKILENRSNALGVSEVLFQVAGNRRLLGEFPGLTNTQEVIAVIKETGQLEFVDMGSTPLAEGTTIITDYGQSSSTGSNPVTTETATAATVETPTAAATSAATATTSTSSTTPAAPTPTVEPTKQVWHTVMTGADLKSVSVSNSSVGTSYAVNFVLSDSGAKIFKDYTTANVGKYLAIVLDKKIISAPQIHSAITEGNGEISGGFTYQSANDLAVQLRYGSLPIPLKVIESKAVGATLGQDSIRKSATAGIIGMLVVVLFMALYYRLPGVIADLALATYALVTFALYKTIPVTLTLAGIAGFVLSIGMAVDANILIFERLKEELRAGRTLHQAIDIAWQRAWLSIRDSNISTIITCVILFWFGSTFGASIVKGFSLTLGLGVLVSMFTAVVVTRTFLHVVLDNIKFTEHAKWFGA
jgi:preprotein translocase subunit SecD